MARNSTATQKSVNRKYSEPVFGGAALPLLDEFDDDTDASWTSWHDAAHCADDWESGTEEMHLLLE